MHPFAFWENHEKEFPLLASLAMKIFSCVPSSAGAERNFSAMGWFHSAIRNRLSAGKVQKMVFVKQNESTANERAEANEALRDEELRFIETMIGESDEEYSDEEVIEESDEENSGDSGEEIIIE